MVRSHQRWLERVSVLVARCNYEVLTMLPRRVGEPRWPDQAADAEWDTFFDQLLAEECQLLSDDEGGD